MNLRRAERALYLPEKGAAGVIYYTFSMEEFGTPLVSKISELKFRTLDVNTNIFLESRHIRLQDNISASPPLAIVSDLYFWVLFASESRHLYILEVVQLLF